MIKLKCKRLHFWGLGYRLKKGVTSEKDMNRLLTISAMILSYFVFAILLNSVGTVILQSIASFEVSKPQASVLEGYKDLSIALVSFLVASFIPRVGYKLALSFGLLLVTAACLATPVIAAFWGIKLLFACIGVSFALVKVSVYALVGQLTQSSREHSSLLNTIEGLFMVGSLTGYWLFSFYIDPVDAGRLVWLQVYYLLAGLCLIAFVTTLLIQTSSTTKPEGAAHQSFVAMLRLSYQPLVLIFILSIFLYVLIEQGIGTWLPTFNNQVLQLPVAISVQLTSIFAASLAVGRLLAGQILKKVHWYGFLNVSLLLMAALILLILPLAELGQGAQTASLFDAPVAAFILPLIGLLMAPIYPVLNSVMLTSLAKHQHASMTGLIVVFSALGGTTGSIITGFVFEYFGGQSAFYFSLLPMAGILLSLFGFHRISQRSIETEGAHA